MSKLKRPQKQIPNELQGRDFFQIPNYAIDLLIPYLPHRDIYYIWECAAGNGKISKRILSILKSSVIFSTDIKKTDWVSDNNLVNFLDKESHLSGWIDNGYEPIIIINPPYSLKYRFIDRALEYDVPFAFLIPFDMCNKMAKLFMKGCQGLVPTRRIDYITPTGLSGANGHTSYYHSFWLTYKFDLPEQLTFVELTNEMKENI